MNDNKYNVIHSSRSILYNIHYSRKKLLSGIKIRDCTRMHKSLFTDNVLRTEK
jgi:hypothetical protein